MKNIFNKDDKKQKELEEKIKELEKSQMEFLTKAYGIIKTILDNDKKKFMYEIREEDIELIRDGKKFRAIRKIIE